VSHTGVQAVRCDGARLYSPRRVFAGDRSILQCRSGIFGREDCSYSGSFADTYRVVVGVTVSWDAGDAYRSVDFTSLFA